MLYKWLVGLSQYWFLQLSLQRAWEPKHSAETRVFCNIMVQRHICDYFSQSYTYEVCLLLELVPPVMICVTIMRLSSSPSPLVWLVVVCHSNIMLWSTSLIILSTSSCSNNAIISKLWRNFFIIIPLSAIINLIAAVQNDQYYPVARHSIREAKAWIMKILSS